MIDEFAITFNGPGGATLDRASPDRDDPDKMATYWADDRARMAALWRGKPLVQVGAGIDGGIDLVWLPKDAPIFQEAKDPPIFLGVDQGAARYALDVSAWEDPSADHEQMRQWLDKSRNHHPSLPEDHLFCELRSVMGELSPADAADIAAAKGCIQWHKSHPFCAKCGAPSEPDQGGWRRYCKSCGAMHFPRTDPVVIMLILHKDKALVGRQAVWPQGMYSMLAGFMEPGESIEAAVRRETLEESGVPVGRVQYLACQPWPFPTTLMIACVGEALTDELDPDFDEVEEVLWVSRQDMQDAAAGVHPRIRGARKGAIARDVLDAWSIGQIPDFDQA
ncbi:MAG: NAD(+) diphosphatase [Pseudomonadota bacterium]